MTEEHYISRLREGWPEATDASLEIIAIADAAVRDFPQSAQLWVMRGDLIQLGPESCPHPLDEALRSYQKAVELEPEFPEAWEEIGHYHNAVPDGKEAARPYFDRAARLKRNVEPRAAPNGGPATQLGNLGVTERAAIGELIAL